MYNLSIPKKKLFEKDTRVGIVDIGSDTIRFQIFENFKNNQIPIFNKKVLEVPLWTSQTRRLSSYGSRASETWTNFLVVINLQQSSLIDFQAGQDKICVYKVYTQWLSNLGTLLGISMSS